LDGSAQTIAEAQQQFNFVRLAVGLAEALGFQHFCRLFGLWKPKKRRSSMPKQM